MKKIILSLVAFGIFAYSNAQEGSNSKIKLIGASLQYGMLFQSAENFGNPADFQKLAPFETLNKKDLSSFDRSNYFGIDGDGPTLDVNLIFGRRSEDGSPTKFNIEYKFGLSYNFVELLSDNYSKETKYRTDTLTSSNSGEMYFVDSVNNERYDYRFERQIIYLNGGVTLSSNPDKKFKFYIGLEGSLGYSINSHTYLSYNNYSVIESDFSEFDRYVESDDNSFEFERVENKNGFSGRVSIPMGLDMRLNNDLASQFSQYHIFIESRPNLSYHSIKELGSKTVASNLVGVGFRYDFK